MHKIPCFEVTFSYLSYFASSCLYPWCFVNLWSLCLFNPALSFSPPPLSPPLSLLGLHDLHRMLFVCLSSLWERHSTAHMWKSVLISHQSDKSFGDKLLLAGDAFCQSYFLAAVFLMPPILVFKVPMLPLAHGTCECACLSCIMNGLRRGVKEKAQPGLLRTPP